MLWCALYRHEFPGFNLIYADLFTPPTCPSFGAVFLTNAVRAESKQPQDVRFSASFAAGHFIHSDTHCFGNGHLNDMSWVKVRAPRWCVRWLPFPRALVALQVRWLREEVRRVVRSQDSQRSPPTTLEEEIEAANALVGQLFPLMARQEPFPLELLNPDLSWSTEPLEHEQAMQRHVFMPHDLKGADGRPVDFATRAMTVVIRTRSAVLYYYRNTDHFPDMRPWQCEVVQVPAMVEVRARVVRAARSRANARIARRQGACASACWRPLRCWVWPRPRSRGCDDSDACIVRPSWARWALVQPTMACMYIVVPAHNSRAVRRHECGPLTTATATCAVPARSQRLVAFQRHLSAARDD